MNIVDVLWIISERDNLVNGSSHGIYPFSEYDKHNDRKALNYDNKYHKHYGKKPLYYDDKDPTYGKNGIVYYPVVCVCRDDGVHHDIMSVYGTAVGDYTVTVFAVKLKDKDKLEIVMSVDTDENGVFERNSVIYRISDGQYVAYFYRASDRLWFGG